MPLNFPNSPALNQLYTAFGRTWRWNGEGWESYNFTSVGGATFTIEGTTNEIIVYSSGGTFTIGLPDDVTVTNSLATNLLNVNGNTFSGGPYGVTLSSRLGVSGDINITGKLIVDGLIVSKTGFSGFTGNADTESITDVSLDGGEF